MAKNTRDDQEQSKAFIDKAREIEADEERSAADELMKRLASKKPEPRKGGPRHRRSCGGHIWDYRAQHPLDRRGDIQHLADLCVDIVQPILAALGTPSPPAPAPARSAAGTLPNCSLKRDGGRLVPLR